MEVVDKDGLPTRVGTPSLTEQLAAKAKLKLVRGGPKQAKAEKARRRVITLACQARAEAKRLANAPKVVIPPDPSREREWDPREAPRVALSLGRRWPRKSGRPGCGVTILPNLNTNRR